MGLLKGAAIFGLGTAWGMFVARSRDGREFRMRAHNNCPLKKKNMAAMEMEKAKELDKAANSSESVSTQIPANFTLDKHNYQ